MKNRKSFKKKHAHYQKEQEEIKIKERKKLPKNKKINKRNFYDFLEETENYDDDFSEYQDDYR